MEILSRKCRQNKIKNVLPHTSEGRRGHLMSTCAVGVWCVSAGWLGTDQGGVKTRFSSRRGQALGGFIPTEDMTEVAS